MVAVALHAVNASNIITIKGTKFFDSVTKDQFFINGVAYQPRTLAGAMTDPLARPNDCRRDFALMKELGLNTVRVYQVLYILILPLFPCTVLVCPWRAIYFKLLQEVIT
jgi:hypothetical protein